MLQVSALNHQRQSEHKNFKENSIPLLKFDFSLSPLVNRVKLKGLSYKFLIVPLMADHYWSTWAGSVHRTTLNLCLNPEAREQQSFLLVLFSSPPVVSVLLQALPSHVSPKDPAESWIREHRSQLKIKKKKSSHSFSCFAGLFVKLVQFLIPHSWGSQAEGTEQWEVVAVAMLLRKRSTKSHLLQALCTWRRLCSTDKWRQHAEVRQLLSKSPEGSLSHYSWGLSSLLGPRPFIWQCNPCSPGTQPQMLF